ncbi:MAG: universal stress protein [Planctomycetota bacterium]|nr:MAG: universal stress protein [Planctomycetota bacterium]
MMNLKRIVCPTDFSESSDTAVEFAASLARDSKAELQIVHVREAPMPVGGVGATFAVPQSTKQDEPANELDRVGPQDGTVSISRRLLVGEPVESIVKFAELHNIDLIVMGTHGRTGLSRLLMGSVAEGVVRNAPCAVLTVRSSTRPLETTSGGDRFANTEKDATRSTEVESHGDRR